MSKVSRRTFLKSAACGAAAAGVGVAAARALAGHTYSVQGVDVASYQGHVYWPDAKAAGIDFAFIKATEGTGYTNPYFADNWAHSKLAGVIRGAYHFGRPGTDATAQADYFVNTVRPVSGDLQMALDIEATDGRSPSQVWNWVVTFINRIKYRTGRPGIIYTGFYFWRDSVGDPHNNLNCPLWLAAYVGDPTPYVPHGWSTWTFWQYTSSGSVPGISGNVDRDAFNGTLSNLNNLRLP